MQDGEGCDPEVGLAPEAVEEVDFATVRRGYEPGAVRSRLRDAAEEIRRLNALVASLSQRVAEFEDTPAAKLESDRVAEAMGDEVARLLQSARDGAQERLERAGAECDEMIGRARAAAAAIVDEGREEGREMVVEARNVRERILADLAHKRQDHRAEVEQLRVIRDRLLEALSICSEGMSGWVEELVEVGPRAAAAAEQAGLRVAAGPAPTVSEIEAEIQAARLAGLPLDSLTPDTESGDAHAGESDAESGEDAVAEFPPADAGDVEPGALEELDELDAPDEDMEIVGYQGGALVPSGSGAVGLYDVEAEADVPFDAGPEPPEPAVGDAPESVADDAPEPAVGDAPESVADDAPEPAVGDAPEPAVGDAPESVADDAPEPAVGDAPESVADDAPEAAVGDAPESVADDAPEAAVGDAPEAAVGDAPEAAVGDAPESVADGTLDADAAEAPAPAPLTTQESDAGAIFARLRSIAGRPAEEPPAPESDAPEPGGAERVAAEPAGAEAGAAGPDAPESEAVESDAASIEAAESDAAELESYPEPAATASTAVTVLAESEPSELSDPGDLVGAARAVAIGGIARRLKRMIVEEQGELLDAIRRSGTRAVRGVISAETTAYARAPRVPMQDFASDIDVSIDDIDLRAAGAAIVSVLVEPVRTRLSELADETGDPAELSTAVRSVYRESRSRRAEAAAEAAFSAAWPEPVS